MTRTDDAINAAFEQRARSRQKCARTMSRSAIEGHRAMLDAGDAPRVAEKRDGDWRVNEVAQEGGAAVVPARTTTASSTRGYTKFFDKVPLKYAQLRRSTLARRRRARRAARAWCAAAPTSRRTPC